MGWWATASWGLWNHSGRVSKTRFHTDTGTGLRTYSLTLPLFFDRAGLLAYLNSELSQNFREKHWAARPTLSVSESGADGILVLISANATVQIIELDNTG